MVVHHRSARSEIARDYIKRGWSPIPIPLRKKNPGFSGWQTARITDDSADLHFSGVGNLGVLLGRPSGGLVDVDLDCDEAVAAARILLPRTCTFGRASRPESHYLYVADAAATTKFQAPASTSAKKMLVELRADGQQTVFPGSTHPSNEAINWTSNSPQRPTEIKSTELLRLLNRVAAAALLARNWPRGARHDASLALAGALLGGHWSSEETEQLIRAVLAAANDTEVADRVASVKTTAVKVAAGDAVTGWPTLEKMIDPQAVSRAKEWLGESGLISVPADLGEESSTSRKQADVLLALVLDRCTLFHNAMNAPFARTRDGAVMRLRSELFESLLDQLYYEKMRATVSGAAKKQAIATLVGIARHDSPLAETFVRVGEHEGRVYLDLANEEHQVVEIDERGWRILVASPVNFIRARALAKLPLPLRGGDIEDLQDLLNVRHGADFVLIVAWLLATMKPSGPYPILVLQGRQGSAKSSTARLLRNLVDPSIAPLRTPPRDMRDLAIGAQSARVLAYDNMSGMQVWLSDAFCGIATGTALATRTLYSDEDEVILMANRPIILNGIDDLLGRPDLADRALLITLPEIAPGSRRTEEEMRRKLEDLHPRLLGALLDCVSRALRDLHSVETPRLPRMADFVRWAAAGLPAAGYSQSNLLRALERSKQETTAMALEADAVGTALLDFMNQSGPDWSGSASDLLEQLVVHAGPDRRRELPGAANLLSARLNRLAPTLREAGLDVESERTAVKRLIKLSLNR